MRERLYFAYGSNINLDQMARRCPHAEVISPVTLNGYRLAFRAQSGVATIIPAPAKQVKGLLWKLTPACEKSLDHYEGHPHFYYKDERIKVMDRAGKEYKVMAYIMGREFEKKPYLPHISYYMGIVDGYMQNGIPFKFLHAALDECRQEVEAVREADSKRQFRFGSHDYMGMQAGKRHKPKDMER